MKRNLIIFLIAIVGLSVVAAGTTMTAPGGSEAPDDPRASTENSPRSTFNLTQARAFSEWSIYNLGAAAGALPLVAVLRREDVSGGSPYPANYVSFIYGHCYASGDYGCAPPAEVQVWPACRRHRALYSDADPLSPVPEDTVVRGVPAAFFEGGTRLELYTGDATLVLFARSKSQVLELAKLLRGVNLPVQASDELPQPEGGALDGKLACR